MYMTQMRVSNSNMLPVRCLVQPTNYFKKIIPDRSNCAVALAQLHGPKTGLAFGRSDGPALVARKWTQLWGQKID